MTRKRHIAIIGIFLWCAGELVAMPSAISIDSLLRRMTLEEKVGQMSLIDLGVIAKGSICDLQQPQQIDTGKLRSALEKYHVGSVLNVGCGSGTISLENWRTIISIIQSDNLRYSRQHIPILYGVDAIHGANYTQGATLFPQPIGQAATWNPDLVQQLNAVTAYEVRASGIPWNYSPVLDIGRQPLWSRFFETYGEDVCLSKAMGTAAVSGLQGTDVSSPYRVAACLKHFLGYGFPLSGHDRTPAWIGERELREYFLPTFEAAIRAGARTLMVNSGEINGTPVHADRSILTTLLREELGFEGVVVTDWEDIYKLVSVHHVARDKREAVKLVIEAGVDLSMTPNDFEFNDLLIDLVKSGEVSIARLDESVRRVLQLKKDLGLFEFALHPAVTYGKFADPAHSELSYRVASQSITLLKNDKATLPLDLTKERVLVCGPSANSMNLLNGGWTHTWQGTDERFNTPGKFTIVEALRKSGKVTYAAGSGLDSIIDLESCVALAANADKIVVCLGEQPCTEIPGNIDDLSLPDAQLRLVERMLEMNKPVVLVCCFNRPRIIHSIARRVSAILYAYLPGDEGGRAVADVLTGVVNPSGKLPFTYPSATNALVHYDHKSSEELDTDFSLNAFRPEFNFGDGFSYTRFESRSLTVSSVDMKQGDSVVVNVVISNIGDREGDEVVQLYYKDLVASITPSVRKLAAFQKVHLKKGEEKQVSFVLHASDLSFVNKSLQRVTEPGDFELTTGTLKTMIHVH